jgi:hypothetical protein
LSPWREYPRWLLKRKGTACGVGKLFPTTALHRPRCQVCFMAFKDSISGNVFKHILRFGQAQRGREQSISRAISSLGFSEVVLLNLVFCYGFCDWFF